MDKFIPACFRWACWSWTWPPPDSCPRQAHGRPLLRPKEHRNLHWVWALKSQYTVANLRIHGKEGLSKKKKALLYHEIDSNFYQFPALLSRVQPNHPKTCTVSRNFAAIFGDIPCCDDSCDERLFIVFDTLSCANKFLPLAHGHWTTVLRAGSVPEYQLRRSRGGRFFETLSALLCCGEGHCTKGAAMQDWGREKGERGVQFVLP